jgi:diguanylate cyclase (GGDEF)-like protein/PAS domain S-box-containing protein
MSPARRIRPAFVALAAFVLTALAAAAGWLTSLEFDAADARARLLQREVPSDVVIVGIDAASLAAMPAWPWPREHHAKLLDTLRQAAPRRAFIDIDFSSHQSELSDANLAQALAAWDNDRIVLPVFVQHASTADSDLVLTQPLPEFARHVSLASVNLRPSADGLVRKVRTAWTFEGTTYPAVFAPASGSRRERDVLIDFALAPSSFDYVSYVDVLQGRIDPAVFRNKTVFVGAWAVELGDIVPIPVHRSLPGVAVLALATQTMEDGGVTPVPPWLSLLLLSAWAGVSAALLHSARNWRVGAALAVAACFALVLASIGLRAAWQIELRVVAPVLTTVISFLVVTLRSLDMQTLRALAHALGIRRRDALLHSIVESSTDCIVCVGEGGRIQTANPAAARLFGCEPAVLTSVPVSTFLPALALDTLEVLDRLAGAVTESEGRTLSGTTFPVDLSVSRVRVADERLYTAIVRDISERKAQQRELQHRATHDPLTELPNRSALAAHLDARLTAVGPEGSVELLMLDLCRFKEVNDTLGHNVGDEVLREIAQRFRRTLGDSGFIARIGGDEFTVVVENAARNGAIEEIAARLQTTVRQPIEAGGFRIDVGLSIGIARYPQDAGDAASLLSHADIAMYDSKRRGSAFEHYDAAHDEHSVRKLTMVSALRAAIGTGELRLFYQPQVDLRSGRVESAEALMRWENPLLGRVNPAEFMGIAETTDLIQPLTEWTLREALGQIREWGASGLRVRVAVNLSARLLQDTAFPARLRSLLEASEVSPSWLELEITESAMMLDPSRALRVLKEVNALGVMIAVDDYGTGFSSLGYLRDLPVHALKLDKSFVMSMRSRSEDRVIVESTVQMAHALQLAVVAEGVETEWHAQFLTGIGYDYAQGYCYSPAIPATEFQEWVTRFNAAVARDRAPGPARVVPFARKVDPPPPGGRQKMEN